VNLAVHVPVIAAAVPAFAGGAKINLKRLRTMYLLFLSGGKVTV
jgi:hypothetical protein